MQKLRLSFTLVSKARPEKEKEKWDCIFNVVQPQYISQDVATVNCAISCSYIVSVIFDGGQYRSTDLPRMLFTGSGPLQRYTTHQLLLWNLGLKHEA